MLFSSSLLSASLAGFTIAAPYVSTAGRWDELAWVRKHEDATGRGDNSKSTSKFAHEVSIVPMPSAIFEYPGGFGHHHQDEHVSFPQLSKTYAYPGGHGPVVHPTTTEKAHGDAPHHSSTKDFTHKTVWSTLTPTVTLVPSSTTTGRPAFWFVPSAAFRNSTLSMQKSDAASSLPTITVSSVSTITVIRQKGASSTNSTITVTAAGEVPRPKPFYPFGNATAHISNKTTNITAAAVPESKSGLNQTEKRTTEPHAPNGAVVLITPREQDILPTLSSLSDFIGQGGRTTSVPREKRSTLVWTTNRIQASPLSIAAQEQQVDNAKRKDSALRDLCIPNGPNYPRCLSSIWHAYDVVESLSASITSLAALSGATEGSVLDARSVG